MKNIYLEKELNEIGISKKLINKLNNNDIINVMDLWILKRNDLKNMQLNMDEINQIIIKMQLHGLDLNKKVYRSN